MSITPDDERKERLEQLGWTVIPIDRFDLRPSTTRLRNELERIRRSHLPVIVTDKRDRRIAVGRSAALGETS
jgi:F420-0:gamma-glutamyl ligase